ncbi:MAG: hypothetical protein EU530_03785 [Promethearchaeota archaeon]|nr:MAG: hypothetical protein EU530_03785 [Candidatus Lokiarchaeota archaeon]
MQVQRIIKGKKVICESCGFEYGATKQELRDFQDMMPVHGDEPANLLRPQDMGAFSEPGLPRSPRNPISPPQPSERPNIPVPSPHPRINKDNILRALNFNWISLKDLAQKIGVVGRKEFYVLRMKLNELNRQGYIQMDFQVNQVLIRKLRQSNRTS